MREAKITQPVYSELKTLVAEAARSLAKLDAERLEELALSCEALNRDGFRGKHQPTLIEVREARQEMALLAKVLEATRTNVAVMNRLRELHARRAEYFVDHQVRTSATEVLDGLH
jgi:histidine ammonia-lyase